jgi:hypothetical protein
MSYIVYRFKNADDSCAVAVAMSNEWMNPDTDEHWHISFYNFEEDINVQFQAISCECCGEYILSNIYPIAIPCICGPLDDEYDENYEYHNE